MNAMKMVLKILLRTLLISLALVLFFSLMAGMYYKSTPLQIKTAIVDMDHSPLSRSVIHNIKASEYFHVKGETVDYLELQRMIDRGDIDVGVIIPENTYRDVLNSRNVNILAVLNGTANPIVPKMALMMLGKITMTISNQLEMKIRVEDLGAIPNDRHPKLPLLTVNERVFYSPSLSMESSMLPAFMGLAMQIVSMLIVLFMLSANFKAFRQKIPGLKTVRQLPPKMLLPPLIISLLIVGTAISVAFFTTMKLFGVPFTQEVMWNVVAIIFLFVFSMESISYFLALNIRNGAVLAGIITLIVMPAFMYSGYLVPLEQMADVPKMIGNWFPLSHYLRSLYPVFNHRQELWVAYPEMNILWKYVGLFLALSFFSIIIGQIERKKIIKKIEEVEDFRYVPDETSVEREIILKRFKNEHKDTILEN